MEFMSSSEVSICNTNELTWKRVGGKKLNRNMGLDLNLIYHSVLRSGNNPQKRISNESSHLCDVDCDC